MKKTMEYAGIAVATLLAVSPIVAPMMAESVITVKAATTTPSDEEIQTAINHITESLKDTSYGTDSSDIKTPFPNLLDNNPSYPNRYGYYGTLPSDPSFQNSMYCTGYYFVNNNPNNILTVMDHSKITDADKAVLSNSNITDKINVGSQLYDDKGNSLNIQNDWTRSSNFFNFINLVKNVRDNGGSLKLKTTITYPLSDGDKSVDKEYTLTNNKFVSADVDQVHDAINEFESNLKDVNNLRANDNYPNLISEILYDYGSVNYNGEMFYRGYYANSPEANNVPFSSYDLFKVFKIGNSVSDISEKAQKEFLDNNINIIVQVEDANGNLVDTVAGLQDITNNSKIFKLKFSFQYPDGNGNVKSVDSDKVVTFTPAPELTEVNVNYNDKIQVKDGSKVSDVQGQIPESDSNFVFEDADGDKENAALNTNILPGFYLSRLDAWDALKGLSDKSVYLDGNFDAKNSTKYYQIVQATVPDSFRTFMMNWNQDPDNYKLSANGSVLTMLYGFDDKNNILADSDSITFIREINVGDEKDNSNNNDHYNSVSGIATTHNDSGFYFLYNDNNEKVDNRALVKNSSWKVDGVRTINGVKQYRVSTHEWVNASDVDFVENGNITEGMSIKKLDISKKVNLSSRHDSYGLQNSKLEISKTRALAGGTSWLVDKIGTDVHGGVYYGVSTDEFVKAGEGVVLAD